MYLLNELDPSMFQVESHGDVAITYGRYISMFRPAADEMGSISSIWYERVWAKRDDRWIFLSHRTVHGPSLAPAGVDQTLGTPDTKVWYLSDPAPAAIAKSEDEAELLQIDQRFAAFVTKGDTRSAANGTSADFVMVHDEGWTRGQRPLMVDTQETMLKRVTDKYYDALDFDHVQVEMHGDVGITTGRYLAHARNDANPDRAWSAAWFVRVYQKRNGEWIWLSHRTVRGPTYGPSREAVSDK
jgi:ketosteroid isomerase-like protein